MNYLDLFSGIGGFALGAKLAGLEFDKHYFSEVDEYAARIYRKHFPHTVNAGDVRNINYAKLPQGNWIVSAGFPCQPFSCYGHRRASRDKRNLWPECSRMLRCLKPYCAVFENVPAIINAENGSFFRNMLCDIAESGYDCEWDVISARSLGAPHERKRLWIVAYPGGERCGILPGEKTPGLSGKTGRPQYENWLQFQVAFTGTYSFQLEKGDESFICRMDDGLPTRLDKLRVKGLGNAVVPPIVAGIFSRILEAGLCRDRFQVPGHHIALKPN